jgi:pyruvate/2-oxoglutarate dehydrogenase complex dihydrolipoamide dehydrogenase (E3) component
VDEYDLAVIGAGSAGVWAAPFAARLGARVALVEKTRIGGDCTHTGCVPSKALVQAARVAWHLRTADRYGFDAVRPTVDLGRVMAGVHRAIEHVYAWETPEELARDGVDVLLGAARFEDAHTLVVGDRTRLQARNFLLCTGAHPAIPPIPGLDQAPYWTYESVWGQDRLPRRLLVLGSGPVGTELTQAFCRLGTQVTVFERGDRPLRRADPEASAVVRQVFEDEGVRFRFEASVEGIRPRDGNILVTDRGEDVEGDALLVAAGRRPTVGGLDLERAGVDYTDRGVVVDEHLRTSQKHIYACGDVIGGFQFTHYAAWQASMAVRTLLFPGASTGIRSHVPWTVFTDPEVAQYGLSEAEAHARFPRAGQVRVSRWQLDHLDRAVTDQDRRGFIKVVHRSSGRILGAQIVAARAGELIAELALAIDHRLTLADLSGTIHVYPTYAIGVQQLAAEVQVDAAARSRLVKLARRAAQLSVR